MLNFFIFFFKLNFKKLNYFNIYLYIYFNLVLFILIYKHLVSYYEIEDNLVNYGDLIKIYFIYIVYFTCSLSLTNIHLFIINIFNLIFFFFLCINLFKDKNNIYTYIFHLTIYLLIILLFFTGFI